ncbi:MAG: squalene/phytoene synthase family protein [Chloroflexota bacterium]
MSIQYAAWEHKLLAWAQEAFTSPAIENLVAMEANTLHSAYEYCTHITRNNSRTFHLASLLLPKPKRHAVQALYAFCRSTDDLVDETRELVQPSEVFASWRSRLNNPHPAAHDPIPLAWADASSHYRIPRGYVDQLIAGITRDLTQNRYSTFAELTEYCYGVASTVGLMSMHIVGFESRDAVPYAVKLGIALQLTNILRDIGEDWRAGRVYLPLDELADFGLSESSIATGKVDKRWRAFMRFQINRVHQLYDEAEPGIAYLDKDGRLAITAAARLYQAILDDIETHDYDVFRHRAHIKLWGKLSRLPSIWWNKP